LTFRALVLRGIAFVTEQETALPQMRVELAGQVFGRTQMQPVLAENSAQRIAERALAGAGVTDEYGRDRGLLAGVLYRPRQTFVIVAVNFLIARGQHLNHVLAQQAPITGLGRDAPSSPEVEAAIDDAPIIARTKNQAAILPPLRMREPPTSKIDGLLTD